MTLLLPVLFALTISGSFSRDIADLIADTPSDTLMTMTRVFKTRDFARWMRKTELTDRALCAAIIEMEQGLIDADIGGGVVKKRVALPGRGKSGGARTLVATNKGSRWFFLFGFEKNERANITNKELRALQAIADDLLALASKDLDALAACNELEEICHGDQT